MKTLTQPITISNVFEKMAVIAKKKLISNGIEPRVANELAIQFVKERGEVVLNKIAKQ